MKILNIVSKTLKDVSPIILFLVLGFFLRNVYRNSVFNLSDCKECQGLGVSGDVYTNSLSMPGTTDRKSSIFYICNISSLLFVGIYVMVPYVSIIGISFYWNRKFDIESANQKALASVGSDGDMSSVYLIKSDYAKISYVYFLNIVFTYFLIHFFKMTFIHSLYKGSHVCVPEGGTEGTTFECGTDLYGEESNLTSEQRSVVFGEYVYVQSSMAACGFVFLRIFVEDHQHLFTSLASNVVSNTILAIIVAIVIMNFKNYPEYWREVLFGPLIGAISAYTIFSMYNYI